MDLLRQFDNVCKSGVAVAGYTSGLCGEWTKERFQTLAEQVNVECFKESFSDIECEMFFKKKDNEGKYMLDLGKAVSLSMRQEGVQPQNIHDEGHCTYHTTTFSSWRRTGDKKKQIVTYIMLQ